VVLVVFGNELPPLQSWKNYAVVVASAELRAEIQAAGLEWIDIAPLVGPGSIYEASELLEELSYVRRADGSRIAKSFLYGGYELWWIHYDSLFFYYCLPYTQYNKLLAYLKDFKTVSVYRPPFKTLFSCYLQAYESKMTIVQERGSKRPSFIPFGIFLQILITLVCVPILAIQRKRLMVYTGDKIEKDKDYDSRMKFVYEELRQKKIPFVEFVRSLESWRTVVQHMFTRMRPVIYPEAISFIGRFASILSGGRRSVAQEFDPTIFAPQTDPYIRFKQLLSIQYFLGGYDDIVAIRIMKWILYLIGVKVTCITAATERSWHTVIACKLNAIPTIGILHGTASRQYNVYDFMPGFDGEKTLSVDRYGLWSQWWREYYLKNSSAYKPEQLFISGPMRPLQNPPHNATRSMSLGQGETKVLFVSEIVAVPEEVMPYLDTLIGNGSFSVYIKFRSSRDSFEGWLTAHRPDVLAKIGTDRILKGNMHEAIERCDVVVGSQSMGVLEAVMQLKVPLYFRTQKWGDYYSLADDPDHPFFAENTRELIERIQQARSVTVVALENLRERYFGDPYKNGSIWVVEQAEQLLG